MLGGGRYGKLALLLTDQIVGAAVNICHQVAIVLLPAFAGASICSVCKVYIRYANLSGLL